MTGKQQEVEASTGVNSADALVSTDAVQGNGSSSGSGSMGTALMSPNACEGPNAEEQRSAIRQDFRLFDTSHDLFGQPCEQPTQSRRNTIPDGRQKLS